MNTNTLITFLITLHSMNFPLMAAEIGVQPGLDTLPNAISSANSGDTLLLQDGTYATSGSDVLVDKTLTIKAASKYYNPVIARGVIIENLGASVILQGLTFLSSVQINAGQAIQILQNTFESSLNTANYRNIDGDGELLIVGNNVYVGGLWLNSDNAFVAGNTFVSGRIRASVPVSIIGNLIDFENAYVSSSSDSYGVITIDTFSPSTVIGNRINVNCDFLSTGVHFRGCAGILILNSTSSIISGNTISLDYNSTGSSGHANGIAISRSYDTLVSNNVIYRTPSTTWNSSSNNYGIYNGNTDTVVSNILYDLYSMSSIAQCGPRVAYNISYETGSICTGENGNQEIDPQFQDLSEFRLLQNSPAINAGAPDYKFTDLDRTRNDIGAYGGPWSIEQFDIQREPGRNQPFIYPLFNISDVAANDELKVRAIGIARLQ